jgi:hypothetical protein
VTPDELPRPVLAVTEAYRCTVDRLLPDVVTGLHLTGSVALGDYRPDRSDIDFVAVCAERPDDEVLGALHEVHAEVRARFPATPFEGVYLTSTDLTAGPDKTPGRPYHHDGAFQPEGRFNLSPITWHELADHAVTLWGPEPAEVGVWTDVAALKAWCQKNLTTYWSHWAHRVWHPGDRLFTASLLPREVEWAVLGVARLHATITTGRIMTKAAGGAYARERFDPRWHDLIDTALRIRSGRTRIADRVTAFGLRRQRRAFVAMVIESAGALAEPDRSEPERT